MEHNPTEFGDEKILICEPCNYASNIAYYHSMVRICEKGDDWSFDEVFVRD